MGKYNRKRQQKAAIEKYDSIPKSRKSIRKEKRSLVKLRRKAFSERKVIPTTQSLNKEREDKNKEIMKKEKQIEKNKRKKEEKKRKRTGKTETVKKERQAVVDAISSDQKEITKYGKLLRLNKRKSKTISQGFKNDGLDYLLEAVDSELLQSLVDNGQEEGVIGSALSALDSFDNMDDRGSSEDEEQSESESTEGDHVIQQQDDSDTQMDVDGAGSESDDNNSDVETRGEGEEEEEEEGDEDYSGYYWPSDQDDDSDAIESNDEEPASDKNSAKNKQSTKVIEATESILKAGKVKQTESKTDMNKKAVHFDSDHDEMDSNVSNLDINKTKSKNRTHPISDEPPLKKLKINKLDKHDVNKGVKTNKQSRDKNKTAKDKIEIQSDSDPEDDVSDDELLQDDDDNDDLSGDNKGSGSDDTEESRPQLKEDIYVRLRDSKGNVVTSQAAYVPPGKRLAMMSELSEKAKFEVERLKRQLKGQFNRLSESNMQSIANHIQALFRRHSRAHLTECLSTILMESLVSSFPVPERLIMEHCLLLAILHAEVGMEIGATFLQCIAKKFNELFKLGNNYGQGKEMDNLVVILSHLCNYKVLNCLLMYDVMRKFAESFKEKDIDLLLIIFRNVGLTLRKEDPAALKEFITLVQTKSTASVVDKSNQSEYSSRMQFMLEVINHIKNNNLRKIPNYDHTHVEQLKKVLRHCTGSRVGEGEMRISLADLQSADANGKWWLVGSAWSGRSAAGDALADDVTAASKSASSSANDSNSEILELARQQRMNTDVRKNIFCTIVTSEDYIDAFEKLLHLGLKQQQEREIMHVIIDICLQQKHFNPFYAFLAQKFCQHNRKFQMSAQYNLWDKFKTFETLGDRKCSNMALFTAHLLSHKSLPLSIFKVIEFAELDKSRMSFMKLVLTTLLLNTDDVIIEEVFLRISGVKKLHLLCEGLKLFFRHFLRKEKVSNELLSKKITLAETSLESKNSKLRM